MIKQITNSLAILTMVFVVSGCMAVKAPKGTQVGVSHIQNNDEDIRDETTNIFLSVPF